MAFISSSITDMVTKLCKNVWNRFLWKVTKFQALNVCRKKVISEKPEGWRNPPPPTFLGLKCFYLQPPTKMFETLWNSAKIHVSRACLKPLISAGKSNGVKIRILSKNLGTRLLRTTRFIKIPWRPKILSPKSQGTSFINLTYFKFACGDENR